MDITLGPWTVDLSVDQTQGQPIADAMGVQAFTTVKATTGFTPVNAVKGKPAASGFTISGKLTLLQKEPNGMHVQVKFTVLVDGSFPNIAPVPGDAWAVAPNTPIDAVQAVTEARIGKILGLIKSGQIKKAR
jgi:hypothetical protein